MGNRDRDCGVDAPVFLTHVMMLIAYLGLLIILCGSSGSASLYKGNAGRACLQGDRGLQLDELSKESLGKLQKSGKTSAVFRTDGEPMLNKRFLRGSQKRAGKPSDEDEFMNPGSGSAVEYDSRDVDILKSLIRHLINHPRIIRAEKENYDLRKNYIPRLGKKRSYSEEK